jgi:hypothetical protein
VTEMKSAELQCILPITTSTEVMSRVATIQKSMVEATEGSFSQGELDHLQTVIRLTVEFRYYLEATCTHENCVTYVSESIFYGIESYCSLTRAYSVLIGATDSKIEWSAVSSSSIGGLFTSTFDAFDRESSFERKCRLLLDLFKIQIIWAAMSYR